MGKQWNKALNICPAESSLQGWGGGAAQTTRAQAEAQNLLLTSCFSYRPKELRTAVLLKSRNFENQARPDRPMVVLRCWAL